MNFDFIVDPRFKELLICDYKELQSSLASKSSKAVLILSGSIIEACLVEYFLQNLPNGKQEADLLKMSLSNLIDLSESEGLLTTTQKKLASVVQDYRNLIHPGRQIRKQEKYDFETAKIAFSLLEIFLETITNKQKSVIQITANEIIEKLRFDWGFKNIYSKVILKLKPVERNNLFLGLLKYEIISKEQWDNFATEDLYNNNYYDENSVGNAKALIDILKPFLEPDFIDYQLNELLHEIQKGDKLKAFVLFNCLNDQIDRLKDEDQEMIAIYFLFSFENFASYCEILSSENTFSNIGKWIKTQEGLKAFEDFTTYCIVHFEAKYIHSQMNVFELAYKTLSEENRIRIKNFILSFILSAGEPPIYIIHGFIGEAIDRGIIDESSLTYNNEE